MKLMRKNEYYVSIIATVMAVCIVLCGCGSESVEFSAESQEFMNVSDEVNEATKEMPADDTGENGLVTECYVHVCGAVANPGVYCVSATERLYGVIQLAGGFTSDAEDRAVNLASLVCDGMQIYIPTKEEYVNQDESVHTAGYEENQAGTQEQNNLVNINTADMTLLCTLPGIGENKARAIIDYRQKHGGFGSVDELMQVDGIKAGVYEKIKELIRV